MKLFFAALVAASQAFAQQAAPAAKTTEQQARSYVSSAFMTGAAPMVLSESVIVSPALRQRLGLAADADSRAVYQALTSMTAGKPVQVRRAEPDEIAKAQAPAAPDKPLFALESGETTLILQYDLERDNVAFIGLPGAVAVAAPVVAPAPPEKLSEPAAQPAKPVVTPEPAKPVAAAPAVAEPAKPAPVLQVVEPQLPRVVKPATQAARPVQPAPAAPMPEMRPRLQKSGPCEIKPVMSDQDLVNCGATPR
jgi:hypothetical protein